MRYIARRRRHEVLYLGVAYIIGQNGPRRQLQHAMRGVRGRVSIYPRKMEQFKVHVVVFHSGLSGTGTEGAYVVCSYNYPMVKLLTALL